MDETKKESDKLLSQTAIPEDTSVDTEYESTRRPRVKSNSKDYSHREELMGPLLRRKKVSY